MLSVQRSRREHRLRAIYRLIARIKRYIEFVDTIHDIDDFKQQLWPDEDLRRKVIAEKYVARMYRRRLFRLRCLKSNPFL
jgi:hypothetical protein